MTKKQEEKLLKVIEELEKRVYKLEERIENNKLEKAIYSVAEVAEILHKTPRAVYNMIERGELETIRLGHLKVKGESLRKKLKGEIQ